MLDIPMIQHIVDRVLKVEKKTDFGQIPYVPKKKPDEYFPGYWLAVEAMEEIAPHALKGHYPERLIAVRAPNMTDIERKYIYDNFKQITLPVYVDWLNTIKRAYADNNWAIEYPQDDGAEGSFRHYVEQGLKKTSIKMSLKDFVKQILPSVRTVDAMGCLAVKPDRIKTEIIDGEQVIASELLEPVPVYYSSRQLHSFADGEFYLFLTNEKTTVTVGGRDEDTGFVYELYDTHAIYKIKQVGAKKDYQYIIEEYYRHDTGDCPVVRLGGIPEYRDGTMTYISPFSYVTPLLDEALLDANMLRGVKATTMFPYRVMVGNICEHKMELGGEIKCCDGRGWFDDYQHNTVVKCPSCGGSGLRDRVSPMGVMLMRPEDTTGQSELKVTQPAMYYVSPSVDVPQFTRQEIKDAIKEARRVLHIRDSSTEVKGAEDMTATGMVIDEKALYAFIKPIADQDFALYAFMLHWSGVMRYGTPQEFILTPPISFDFKTEYDYLMEISLAIKNGLPPFVVHTIVLKYLKTLFYNQLESAAAFNLIVQCDRLLCLDDEEVAVKLSRGIVMDWEVILHDSAISFVMELTRDNERFLEQPLETQITAMQEMAKAKAAEGRTLRPASAPSVVNALLGE